ncbi:hypothetical protein AB0F91_06165 [Amycolatopsis sp. NPDC023774]|uniref:hypothetical protein n=1 Tax=Amycolatopsis sp. NPDC023774 TaxID=3155015 RepID=UPI0033F61BE3
MSLLTAVLVVVFPSGSTTSAYATGCRRIPFLIGAVRAFVLFSYARKTAESRAWAGTGWSRRRRTGLLISYLHLLSRSMIWGILVACAPRATASDSRSR